MKRLVECLNPHCGNKFWDNCDKDGNTDRAYCRTCENLIRQREDIMIRNVVTRKKRKREFDKQYPKAPI